MRCNLFSSLSAKSSACWLFVILLTSAAYAGAAASYRNINDDMLENIKKRYGADASLRISAWRDLLNQLAEDPELVDAIKMRDANNFFNKIQWVFDDKHWGVEDYWATPIETLATNGGDCEDFSIGKYFSLKDTGVKTSKLRITYVKALDYNLAHMVLAYYPSPGAEPLILDNINKTILPASKRKDLLPIYSFNGDGLWLAKSRGKELRGDAMKSLPQWRSLHSRMQQEWQ